MQFRIKHLLAFTTFICLFAWALASPSEWTVEILRFVGWLAALVLSVRAISQPGRERHIIVAGLLGAVSYWVLVNWDFVDFPTSRLIKLLNPNTTVKVLTTSVGEQTLYYPKEGYEHFRTIGEMTVAVIIGLLMATLSAYWTRKSGEA